MEMDRRKWIIVQNENQNAGRIGEVSQPAGRLSIFTLRLFAPAVLNAILLCEGALPRL